MRKQQAFTLIELLVVIDIIALLMAILVPSLQRVKRQAKAVACQSNLRQWGLYFYMYTENNDQMFFNYPDVDPLPYAQRWLVVMWPYWRDCNDLLFCPIATKHMGPTTRGGKLSAWCYDNSPPTAYDAGSYGLNWQIMDARGVAMTQEHWEIIAPRFWRTCIVKNPQNVPVLGDCAYGEATMYPQSPPPEYDDATMYNSSTWFCINRHDGYVNCAFLDFHVRKVGLKELWTLKWHREFNTAGPWTKAGGVQCEDWPQWMRSFKDY